MVATPLEMLRRRASRRTHRLHSLPILALSVHSACNCRCVMCDIWKANREKREIAPETLDRHLASLRRLHVQRVMMTGGEPLLHSNLWALCDRLRAEGIRLTLVTTGLLVADHAHQIAARFDEVFISVDGGSEVHDDVRGTRGGIVRIRRGVAALRGERTRPRIVARSVLQRANYRTLADTIASVHAAGFDALSFLAADVSSAAFNRPEPWSPARAAEVAIGAEELDALARAIRFAERSCAALFAAGFVAAGARSLWRIHDYYRAVAGLGEFPPVACNAPWVSAVLEPDGVLRPCFFQPAYGQLQAGETVGEGLNAAAAVSFRRSLDVPNDQTCQRCVCTLSLPVWRAG